jgi:putative hydrolase of the HAD superfamily
MLESASELFRLALLSNTNPVHWQQVVSSAPVFGTFEKLFLSFETGRLKPGPAAFTQVLDHFGCSPDDLVFLDDSLANVESARRLGIRSEQVAGPVQLGDTLARLRREAVSP